MGREAAKNLDTDFVGVLARSYIPVDVRSMNVLRQLRCWIRQRGEAERSLCCLILFYLRFMFRRFSSCLRLSACEVLPSLNSWW